MANILLQSDNNILDLEYRIVKEILNKTKYLHSYSEIGMKQLKSETSLSSDLIPIGTIEFVTEFLNRTHGFTKENPIEIPTYLRTDEFLKRKYNIATFDNIPKDTQYFIKDVSTLKSMAQVTSFETIKSIPENEKSSLYQVSEVVNILSEYRVYVIGHEIQNISHYNGDCTLFPDIQLIKKAIQLIKYNEKHLRSYTIDIMINDRGTSLIEIHNFTSVGLYSTLWSTSLIYAYRDGINYLLNDNKVIETT